ncbi:hypothetical protein [Streptomyces sp. NPDC056600]|uniref:hypothetical protein n=1 Tax=Streptomyces sp. NPDC056600 TaxID=3345874 RepID=UPI003675AD63
MSNPLAGAVNRLPSAVRGLSAAALATAVATGLLSGCSSEPDRAYKTPASLCGTKVPAESLEPFLPAGEQVTVKEDRPFDGEARCTVQVDGKQVFVASLEWRERRGGIFQFFGLNRGMKDGGTTKGDDDLMYTERGAVSRLSGCTPPKEDQTLYASLEALADDVGDAEAMKRLASAYTEQARSSDLCRGQG